ncbi:phage gp6-like head-tail connector protein [Halomonas aquamarina]|uniref:Phage gp6-like head-tail connector protein n=1 Tax=Vreelandella aquamarina TaxID=77097 RepID=A0ACC5VZL4_9GAMM|nr:head-tail connector protein [Halomonas aquamarina]MBZ5489147.1 phage gp6-like head-tail connector protein [Halomonas aquamarina]
MLDLEIIKQQCRIEPDESDEDQLLETYSNAARRYVENYTDRSLFETPEAALLSGAESPLVLDDDITTAMLVYIAYRFEDRQGEKPLPPAVNEILWPYRRLGV